MGTHVWRQYQTGVHKAIRRIDARFYVAFPIIGILLVGAVYSLRLGNNLRYDDESDYYNLAVNLIHRHRYTLDGINPTAFRSPGYPWALAVGVFLHFPIVMLRMLNFAALGVSAYLLHRIVRDAGYPLAAIIAPYLILCYPVLLYTAGTLYPQTMGTTLLLLALSLLLRNAASHRAVIAAGAIFGLLILFIPGFAFKIPLLIGFVLLVSARHRVVPAFLFLLASLCIVGVGAIYDSATMRTFIPLSTNGGVNLLLGNSEHVTANSGVNADVSRYKTAAAGLDEVHADRYYRDQAVAWIRNHTMQAATLYAKKVVNYFNYRNELRTTGESSRATDLVMLVTYYPLLLLCIARVLLWRLAPLTRAEIGLLLIYVANSFFDAINFTRIRFRLPFDTALLCVVAAMLALAYQQARAWWNQRQVSVPVDG